MTTTTAKKANRGHLLRAAKKGQLWLKCSYHLTDDYAFDNATGFGKADEFARAYLYVPHESSLSKKIDQLYSDGATHEDVEPIMEELRRQRMNHESGQRDSARDMVTMRRDDFRGPCGSVTGTTESGRLHIHSNLTYEYEIRS